jgi:3-isopropylmalate/(R)-2-methylmalate dehydratase large subunit
MSLPQPQPTLTSGKAIPTTLLDRLWALHEVARCPGGESLIAIDRILLHERTGSMALRNVQQRGLPLFDRARVYCVMDHIVDTLPGRGDDTTMPGGRDFIVAMRDAARAAGVRLFDIHDAEQGIVHVIAPELGIALPGATIVCPDSHTCTQGALGALAWGIGTTDAEHALATGTLRMKKPEAMRVRFDGALQHGVTAKDMSMALVSRHGAAGGKGYVVEYAGSAVRHLDMEQRMTLCNMSTEFSAMTGLVAPDNITFRFVAGRRFAPSAALWNEAQAHWQTLRSDESARFDREHIIDATQLKPMISWGTSPQHAVAVDQRVPTAQQSGTTTEAHARAIAYMGVTPGEPLASLSINAAFIGSCTNSRLGDLRRAAQLLRGLKVAPGVKAICVPGSTATRRQAEAEGLDTIFKAAGFEWRESGCSMCFYAGGESFAPGARVVSTTNRNFEGRQGPRVRTHIASPETVVASALAGHIADARELHVARG